MRNETVQSNVPKMTVKASRNRDVIKKVGLVSHLHYHDEMEFLPVYQGRFVCTVDGRNYEAGAGEVIFINSGIPHATSVAEPMTQSSLLQFRLKDFLDTEIERVVRYSVKFRSVIGAPVRIIRDPDFFRAVDEVLTEATREERGYEMFIKSGIYRILGHLYREEILSDGEEMYKRKEVQKILPALAYINENYASEVDLDTVSAHLGFDPSYFCRIFKTATGATFTEYLNFVRICKAEKLLTGTQDSILEISSAVGISSVSYFNRIFRKYHSCSPRAYRSAQYCSEMK